MLSVVMLEVSFFTAMLIVVMLNVIMLNVIMLSVIMLNVLAPESNEEYECMPQDLSYKSEAPYRMVSLAIKY